MRTLAILVACIGLAASAFAGTMYKWKDEKGVTHFSEDPPPSGKAEMIDVRPVPPRSRARAMRSPRIAAADRVRV